MNPPCRSPVADYNLNSYDLSHDFRLTPIRWLSLFEINASLIPCGDIPNPRSMSTAMGCDCEGKRCLPSPLIRRYARGELLAVRGVHERKC